MQKEKGIKTVLLKNMLDLSLFLLGQSLEIVLRTIRLLMPLGLYHYMLQMQNKPTSTTSIGTFLTPKSTYMFVAPGIILVSITGDDYKKFFNASKVGWKKKFPVIQITIQCLAYLCIIVYFIYRWIHG